MWSAAQETREARVLFDNLDEMSEDMLGIGMETETNDAHSWVLAVLPIEGEQDCYRRVGIISSQFQSKLKENSNPFFSKFPIL